MQININPILCFLTLFILLVTCFFFQMKWYASLARWRAALTSVSILRRADAWLGCGGAGVVELSLCEFHHADLCQTGLSDSPLLSLI